MAETTGEVANSPTIPYARSRAWVRKKWGQIYFLRPARRSASPAALSLVPPTGFALHGESLSLVWPRESNKREGHPGIRVWPAARLPSLRRCSGGRHEGASLPLRSSLGVHASRPPTQHLHSASALPGGSSLRCARRVEKASPLSDLRLQARRQ